MLLANVQVTVGRDTGRMVGSESTALRNAGKGGSTAVGTERLRFVLEDVGDADRAGPLARRAAPAGMELARAADRAAHAPLRPAHPGDRRREAYAEDDYGT